MSEHSLFLAVLDINDPSERSAYLDRACAGDPALRAQVEQLLKAHQESGLFMESPAIALDVTVDDPIRERPGTMIGPYKLLEEIGEGGMGLVFVAEQQQPIKRRVALKIIKPGMDSRQVIARFEAERQALAMMDHPNIAQVHDGGATPEGRPYFVMELVKGTPITDYCDTHRLTTRQRLQLFLDVCSAVQHAHQKGIIHRDLKPSNVLVSHHDVTPVIKVIDFGIAKATSGRLTDKTLYTAFAQMVGTPLYMSPEQAGLSDLDVDTRSDVYSLGVLLYELLTGTTPFDSETLKKAGYDEIRRVIREDEPPRPSTRLSTMQQAALSTIAERRGLEPRRLSQQLRGELDWIVMKALEKDRNRRYESASALAADVQRYLADEPLQASPPSTVYRLKKLARRHKVVLAVAGLIALTVLTVAASAGYVLRDRSTRQTVVAARVSDALDESERLYHTGKVPEALNAAQRAESLLATGSLDEVLAARVQERVEDLQMVLKLEEVVIAISGRRSAEYEQLFRRYGIDLAAQPAEEIAARVRSRLIASNLVAALDQLAVGFFSLDQSPLEHSSPWKLKLMAVTRQIDSDSWRDQVRQAIERGDKAALQDLARTAPLDQLPPVTLRTIAIGLGTLAFEERTRASEESPTPKPLARDFLRRALQRYPSDLWLNWLLADDLQFGLPRDLKEAAAHYRTLAALRPKSWEVYFRLAMLMAESDQFDDAITYVRKVIEVDPQFIKGYTSLAHLLESKGQTDEADAWWRKAIAFKFNENDPVNHYELGNAFAGLNRWDEAIASYKKSIELDPKNADVHNALALAYRRVGRPQEAITLNQQVLEKHKAKLGLDPSKSLMILCNLGLAYQDTGRLQDAIAVFERGKEAAKAKLGPDAEGTLTFMNNLALAYQPVGRLSEAIALLEQTVEKEKAKPRPDGRGTLTYMGNLAEAYQAAGRLPEAIALFVQTVEKARTKLGPVHDKTLSFMHHLAGAYQAAGRLQEAITLHQQTADKMKAKYGPDHPDTLTCMNNLAEGYRAARKLDLALTLHEETLKLRRAKFGPDDAATLRSMYNLADTYQDAGKFDKADHLLRNLLERHRKKDGAKSAETAAILASLGLNLLKRQKYTEAEPLLRECLTIREQKLPDKWLRFNVQSLLGGALLGQQKYPEAEPLLLQGYEGMNQRQAQIPMIAKRNLAEASERIVQLYEATQQPEKARAWREKRPLEKAPAKKE